MKRTLGWGFAALLLTSCASDVKKAPANATPTPVPSQTAAPTPTAPASPTPTAGPTPTPTLEPTASPSPSPSAAATPTPSPSSAATPTPTPLPTPTPSPTCVPSAELCDGEDNDCDGITDNAEALVPAACPLQLGVCAGATELCGGPVGWVSCGPERYGRGEAIYVANETEFHCDDADNDCDGETDEGCPTLNLQINELLYDADPTRRLAFIELRGDADIGLRDIAIEAIAGTNGQAVWRLDTQFASAVVEDDGYFLVVPEDASLMAQDYADLVVGAPALPASASLVLRLGGRTLDRVAYGEFNAADEDFAHARFESRPSVAPPEGESLTRDANHVDTDDNAADFSPSGSAAPFVPTPRGIPLPKIHVTVRWAPADNDLDLHLTRSGGTFGGEGDCYFARRNPSWGDPDFPHDDPTLGRDALDGDKGEFVYIPMPIDDSYLLQLHAFGLGPRNDAGAVVGTAHVFIEGREVAVVEADFTQPNSYWRIGRIDVTGGEASWSAGGEVADMPFAAP